MTKLNGPLLSLDADGTFKQIISLAHRAQRGVHANRIPAPRTTYTRPQLARRTFLRALARAWNALPLIWRESWKPLSTLWSTSPYHAYLAENLARYDVELWPIATNDPPVFPDIPVIGASFSAGPRRLSARPGWVSGQKPVWCAAMWIPPTLNPDRPSRITCWSAMWPSLLKWHHETRVPPGTYRYYCLVVDGFGRASLSKNGYPLVVEP